MKKRNKLVVYLGLLLMLVKPQEVYARQNSFTMEELEEKLETYGECEQCVYYEALEDIEDENELLRGERIQHFITHLNEKDCLALIDELNVESTLKKVLKECIQEHLTDEARYGIVYASLSKEEEEMTHNLIRILEGTYNGLYSTSEYSTENIRILDNCDGKLNSNQHLYLLKDPSLYEHYRIYSNWIDDSLSESGLFRQYIITDEEDKVLFVFHECYLFSSFICYYNDVSYKNVYLEKMEDVLLESGLQSKMKDSYSSNELNELQFKISEAKSKEEQSTIKAEDILVFEVPEDEQEASWWYSFKSLNGKEEKRYILTYECEDLFQEDSLIYKDISHPSALFKQNKNYDHLCQYWDYENEVYFENTLIRPYFNQFFTLTSYLKQKGMESYIKEEYTEKELKQIERALKAQDKKKLKELTSSS